MKSLLQLCLLVLLLGSTLPCAAATPLVDHYRKALKADPQNFNTRYHLGIALLNQGENRAALKAFRKAYPFLSSNPEINFNLALVYSRLNDPDSALLYLDQASASGAASQPDVYPLQNVYFNLALLYDQEGRLEDAVRLLNRLVEESPDRLEYLRLLGEYQLRLNQPEFAIATFQHYLQLLPQDAEVREFVFVSFINRGLAAYEQEDLEGARKEFSRATTFSEESPLLSYYLGVLDYQQEQFRSAVDRLVEVFPYLSNEEQKSAARSILYNSALALKQREQYSAALSALSPLTSVARPRPNDLELQAGLYLEIKKYDLARSLYLRLLQSSPDSTTAATGVLAAEKGAFNSLLDDAGAAFAAKNLALVRQKLSQAAEIYPQDNRLRIYQMRLSRAARESWLKYQREADKYANQQRYSEALDQVRKGLALAPDEPQLKRQETRLLQRLAERMKNLYLFAQKAFKNGEFRKAQISLKQLIELDPDHSDALAMLDQASTELKQAVQQATVSAEEALDQKDYLAAQQFYRRALTYDSEAKGAKEGLLRAQREMTAEISSQLVRAKRARSDGRLRAAHDILAAALGQWSDKTLELELVEVEALLQERQTDLLRLAEGAIQAEEFSHASQFLGQAKRINANPEDLARLNTMYVKARESVQSRLLQLAQQQLLAGEYDAGIDNFRKVLEFSPGNEEALSGLQQARSELEGRLDSLLAEGASARKAGDLNQARTAYRKVLTLDPLQPTALSALKEIEHAGRAGITGRDTKRLYLQGIELYTEGEYRQAIVVWRQVLDIEPSHEKARMNIDKAERKLKQIQERERG